jgi:hypothetical protein
MFNLQARTWLELLLYERFGHGFNLTLNGESLLLSIEGNDRAISFEKLIAEFYNSGSDLPCCKWNAAIAGWPTALDPVLPAPGASALPSPLIEPTAHGYRIHYFRAKKKSVEPTCTATVAFLPRPRTHISTATSNAPSWTNGCTCSAKSSNARGPVLRSSSTNSA